MPVTQHEAGYVSADGLLHVARKRVDATVALCGAGRIVQAVPGRFDSDDANACPGCAQASGASPL